MKDKGQNKRKGNRAEQLAADYLSREKRHQILARNYLTAFGEIDIISEDDETLVFTEVKYRENTDHGLPGQAVGKAKQRHIIQTALYYLQENAVDDRALRFDVIEVWQRDKDRLAIHHIENAFHADRDY
ncbi:YraN family protein [Pseudoramibacter alactolyticus]|uniref:YraN family protein n=1 Tax=Pseudoramibacter alactolyticus TaxID=113287 RepID=UPI0028E34006|nr:YraN family protein [Pseudoramibacter alactolyticus]